MVCNWFSSHRTVRGHAPDIMLVLVDGHVHIPLSARGRSWESRCVHREAVVHLGGHGVPVNLLRVVQQVVQGTKNTFFHPRAGGPGGPPLP